MLFMLDMTDLRCVNAGNIRGNVSSNDLLATAPTQFCVKLSDSSRALWPGDELKMEQFQHLQTSTPSHFDWTPGNTSFISSTRLAITVNFTLSVECIIKLNSFQAHLAWSSFPFNKTKIWFQFLIIETWDGPLIFCLYYITYCGLKAIEAIFGLMRNLLSGKKYHGLCFMFIVVLAVLHHDYDQTFFFLQLSESGRRGEGLLNLMVRLWKCYR